MTLKEKIENYIGTFADTNALDNWLNSAVRFIIDLLPDDEAIKISEAVEITSTGIDVTERRILEVTNNGKHCINYPAKFEFQITDANSLYKATEFTPAYIIKNGVLKVYPTIANTTGTATCVTYPALNCLEEELTGTPPWEGGLDSDKSWDNAVATSLFFRKYQQLIILYTAIQAKIKLIKDKITGTIIFSPITAPDTPSAPMFSYSDVVYTNASYTDATYTAATYTNALIATITETLIGSVSGLPTYTPQSPSTSFTNSESYIGTEEDLEKASTEINLQGTKIQDFQSKITEQNSKFNSELEAYKTQLQKAIEQARITQERLVKQTELQVNLNSINAKQEIDTLLTNASKSSEISVINAARKMELDITNKSKALEAQIINESKELERQINEYSSKLQKYEKDVNKYQVSVGQEVQRVTVLVQQYLSEHEASIKELSLLKSEFNDLLRLSRLI